MFSTQLHGESFARMASGLTKGGGPTLLLVRDAGGHVFGAFASRGWEVKPQFQGERVRSTPLFDCRRARRGAGHGERGHPHDIFTP